MRQTSLRKSFRLHDLKYTQLFLILAEVEKQDTLENMMGRNYTERVLCAIRTLMGTALSAAVKWLI